MRRAIGVGCLVAGSYAGLAVWLSLLSVYLDNPVVPGIIVAGSYAISGLAVRGVLHRRALPVALVALAAGSAFAQSGWPSWALITLGLGLLRPGMLAMADSLFASQGGGGAIYNGALNVGLLVGGVGGDLLRAAFGWKAMFQIVAVVFMAAAALSLVLAVERQPIAPQPAKRRSRFALTLLTIVGLYTALSAQSNGVAPLVLEDGSGAIHAGMLASLHAGLVAACSALSLLARVSWSRKRAGWAAVGLMVASVSFLVVGWPRQAGHQEVVGFIVVFALAESILTPTVLSFASSLPGVQRVLFWWVHGFGFLAGALLAKAWRPLGTGVYFCILAALAALGGLLVCLERRNPGWERTE